MKAVESWLRASEDAAAAVTDRILNSNNIFLSILLVGALTGLSEEVLFRGGLQRILATRPMNIHIAIWISAFIFSAIHFQFFGFFPRLIIGAFLGYLAYWSGSLWIAVIAHAVNNSTVIIAHAINNTYGYNLDSLGVVDDGSLPVVATISLIITIVLIYLFPKNKKVTS
jgi:membrane protease YdiL (CAAX protease family)